MNKYISVMIKPASGNCNLECEYCFYKQEVFAREKPSNEFMSISTLKNIVDKTFNYAEESVSFIFQGGEPTLIGLNFYREFVEYALQKKENRNVYFYLQTNGININNEWCEFLKKNNFLVGISIDGTIVTHNKYRKYSSGKGSYDEVVKGIKRLMAYGVETNILTVLTDDVVKNFDYIYNDYKSRGYKFLQFIPCINMGDKMYLSNKNYLIYLKKAFKYYIRDFQNNDYISIRFFDNIASMYQAKGCEECGMNGKCSKQFVVESNGDVYPCDFYCVDEYLIGNINQNSLEECEISAKAFISNNNKSKECLLCPVSIICNSGCKRYRTGKDYKHVYCEALKEFYEYAHPYFYAMFSQKY